ncbi:hypothetical protein SD72_02825 [Leucobacter komagatae]|uniref:Peptidoglycan-binding protein n=1 Tax=Leucobacter komagatae TaxID=55969 RepID=A0A0D0IVH3_9MICO|nr:hypothetical protein SD72_02825 [Leucobacter komagatae]
MRKGEGIRRVSVGALLLALMLVAAVGVSIGLILAPDNTPVSLSPAARAEDLHVSKQDFDDRRNVELGVATLSKRPVTTTAVGTVTRFECEPGSTLSSGTASFFVDDRPVLTLATQRPLWRNLDFDTEGDDVASLQAELRRLGKDVPDHGYFDWVTWNAYREIVEASGGKTDYGALSRADILWIATPDAVVETCDAQVGSALAPDQVVATLPVALRSVQIKNPPVDVAPGERVLAVDGVQLPIDDEGRITSTDALAELITTPTYTNYVSSEGESVMSGIYSLAEPISVIPVPPSAIYGWADGQGCIIADGQAVPVDVVGSQLGRSFITVEAGADPSTVRTVPDEETPCR